MTSLDTLYFDRLSRARESPAPCPIQGGSSGESSEISHSDFDRKKCAESNGIIIY